VTSPDLTLSYGPLPEQVLDVRLPPSAAAAPLLVVVHGGFWKAEWDRAHAAPQSQALAAAGHVVATVEYRRVGMPGGGWPGTLDDVALLTDTGPAVVASAVPGRVDPAARPVLVGHSAGGHLAVWSASRHRLPAGSPWHRARPPAVGVVSLAGVLDLRLAHRLGLGGAATRALLGGTPDECPDRYAAADPTGLVPTGVPTVLVHGRDDEEVPLEVSEAYRSAARAAGQEVTLHSLAGVGHMSLVEPGSAAWPAVLEAIANASPQPSPR
jgi:acetyl esterase/lipase